MIEVDLFRASLGGGLIGLGAGVLWLTQQRVAGISGIAAGLLPPWNKETKWRLWFITGLVVSRLAFQLVADVETIDIDTSPLILALSGLLVGYGSRLGGGCTSGHGICGIARFSTRSLVATLTFMITAGIVVYISRHFI